MTEEALARLAVAREKALAKKRELADAARREAHEKLVRQAEERLLKEAAKQPKATPPVETQQPQREPASITQVVVKRSTPRKKKYVVADDSSSSSDSEVDMRRYYKNKYKQRYRKGPADPAPPPTANAAVTAVARDELRRHLDAESYRLAWASVFGVPPPN